MNYGQGSNQFNMNLNPQNNFMNNQNFMNQGMGNQMSVNPNTFVFAKIGHVEIVNEDLMTFKNNIKSTEWTQNSTYKNAKNIQITTSCGNSRNDNNQRLNIQNNFNNYLLSFPPHLTDFTNYENDINERFSKLDTEDQNKNREFITKHLSNTSTEIDFQSLLSKISENRSYILSKDQVLYKKVEKILPLLNQSNQKTQFQNQPQMNQPMQPQMNQPMQPQMNQPMQPQINPPMQPQINQPMQPQPYYMQQAQQPPNIYGNNSVYRQPNSLYNNNGAPTPAMPANFYQKF